MLDYVYWLQIETKNKNSYEFETENIHVDVGSYENETKSNISIGLYMCRASSCLLYWLDYVRTYFFVAFFKEAFRKPYI